MEIHLLQDSELLKEDIFSEFVRPYRDAMLNMQLRVDTISTDLKHNCKDCPIHNVQQRIKAKDSIEKKLKNRKLAVSIESAKDHLTDIAGIRIICYFEKNVYTVASLLKKQADLIVIKETDYIKDPKPNGYRSYHMVFGVPVYYTERMDYYPVEVQIRTLSMDLWASMDHRISYKLEVKEKETYNNQLMKFANQLKDMEKSMEKLCESISNQLN